MVGPRVRERGRPRGGNRALVEDRHLVGRALAGRPERLAIEPELARHRRDARVRVDEARVAEARRPISGKGWSIWKWVSR